MNDKIYMMTWKDRKVFVFNKELELEETMEMPHEMKEGWGLTHDEHFMYSTDGTANIYKINPDGFRVISHVTVQDSEGRSINNLNEIEYVGNNEVLVNKWMKDDVYRVSLSDGKIIRKYDLSELKKKQKEYMSENGDT